MKFTRGTVVYHKVMGKGVVLNEANKGMIEVRMANGHIEKFYAEELETEEEVQARWNRQAREINQSNKTRFDPYD